MEKNIAKIELLLLDVDGVMTSGEIVYTDGGKEIKCFSVKDGLGIRLLINAGISVGIVSGRSSPALTRRANELGIGICQTGVSDKREVLDKICAQTGLLPDQIAFMGDDLPDIRVMKAAGFSFAPADAVDEVKKVADFITKTPGGKGAVREACEVILKRKSLWQQVVASLL